MPDEELVIVGGYSKGDHAKGYAENIVKNFVSLLLMSVNVKPAVLLVLPQVLLDLKIATCRICWKSQMLLLLALVV